MGLSTRQTFSYYTIIIFVVIGSYVSFKYGILQKDLTQHIEIRTERDRPSRVILDSPVGGCEILSYSSRQPNE
jgi:hypothetical protein